MLAYLIEPRLVNTKPFLVTKIVKAWNSSANQLQPDQQPHIMGVPLVFRTWYPPGESTGYIEAHEPPQPKVPSGVNTRLGFVFGQLILFRGSTGKETVFPQKNPTVTAISVPLIILSLS